MSELFAKWLAHYDPIHFGFTPRGIANGVSATCGRCFPRTSGGYNLYRGSPDAEAIDFSAPVGAAGVNATSIRNFPGYPHAPSTSYAYVVRSIGGGGVESAASAPPVVVEFDEQGRTLGPRPNPPTQLIVRPIAGGAFQLRWTYCPIHEPVPPVEFHIYTDWGSGVVNFEAYEDVVAYRRGVVHYAYTTRVYLHGSRRLWAVRTVSATGATDGNTHIVGGYADSEYPPVHPALVAGRSDEE
jgi:hypothetical protein